MKGTKTNTVTRRVKRAADSAASPEIRFAYSANPTAKSVSLVGDFNGWDTAGHRMSKRGGAFVKRLRLDPGEYAYKYLVDGEWESDTAADAHVPDGFGGMNSLVRV